MPAETGSPGTEVTMPIWFWLNIPACMLFFLATAGIPLWLVLTRPDAEHVPAARRVRDRELVSSTS
jgi:hypothetical protein